MEIFSGQHFSFSSFLPIETLRKWEDFGDDPLRNYESLTSKEITCIQDGLQYLQNIYIKHTNGSLSQQKLC